MAMKDVDRIRMVHHRTRAKAFFDAMRLVSDDLPSYGEAVALLAVHSAISLSDAVVVAMIGARSNAQDHVAASKPLETLCQKKRLDRSGIKHLSWLLHRKTRFAYDDDVVVYAEIKLAAIAASRFRAWVYRTFPEVAYENDSSS